MSPPARLHSHAQARPFIFCDGSTRLDEEEVQSRKTEERTAATELARAIVPVQRSAGRVRFGVGCLLALAVLRLHSRRPSADRQQPAGAVMAVPSGDPDLAPVESLGGLSSAFLSSAVFAWDAGHSHARRALALVLASVQHPVACRLHLPRLLLEQATDRQRSWGWLRSSAFCGASNSR